MTTTNDSLKLAELLKTPICKMDGEELAFLITSITSNQQAQMLLTQPKQEEHNVYGIAGIAQIFGYGSRGTAIRYWGFPPLNFRETLPPNRNNLFETPRNSPIFAL